MNLEDESDRRETDLDIEVEAKFDQQYLDGFTERPPFVRLESEDFADHPTCTVLISILQKCISKANVLTSLTRPQTNSVTTWLP